MRSRTFKDSNGNELRVVFTTIKRKCSKANYMPLRQWARSIRGKNDPVKDEALQVDSDTIAAAEQWLKTKAEKQTKIKKPSRFVRAKTAQPKFRKGKKGKSRVKGSDER